MSFQYIAIEGPIGVGKTALAERLATRLDAATVLEETENPFLADFYAGRPGAALQAQLFYLLNRHRQQLVAPAGDLFAQTTVCDYLFDKDKIFAYLNLDDNELFIYQRLYDLLARDVAAPDLVSICRRRPTCSGAGCASGARSMRELRSTRAPDYLRELNEAYQHFFFHYTATPLLVVETSQLDLAGSDEALDDLIRQINDDGPGHAVLRAADVRRPACRMQNAECEWPTLRRSVPACRPWAVLTVASLTCVNTSCDGLVQEDPEADRLVDGRKAKPGSRGALGQVPGLRAAHLQQGSRGRT